MKRDDWSDNILAEFNSLIAKEINELRKEEDQVVVSEEERNLIEYKHLLNEFGITDDVEVSNLPHSQKFVNSDYDEPRDKLKQTYVSSDYDEPNDVITEPSRLIIPNNSNYLRIDLNGDDKLPPKYNNSNRKTSLPINLTSHNQKRSRKRLNHRTVGETDYDDVRVFTKSNEMISPSGKFDGFGPRSAPVTPTDEKKAPFSKFLRRRQTKNSDAVVLVRVSSLPDQDVFDKSSSNDRIEAKNFRKVIRGDKTDDFRHIRSVSPFTLRSDISAKRLSESDRDVRQISPVELKRFDTESLARNDVAVSCHIKDHSYNDDNHHVNGLQRDDDDNHDNHTSNDGENYQRIRSIQEHNARSGSVSRFFLFFN